MTITQGQINALTSREKMILATIVLELNDPPTGGSVASYAEWLCGIDRENIRRTLYPLLEPSIRTSPGTVICENATEMDLYDCAEAVADSAAVSRITTPTEESDDSLLGRALGVSLGAGA